MRERKGGFREALELARWLLGQPARDRPKARAPSALATDETAPIKIAIRFLREARP